MTSPDIPMTNPYEPSHNPYANLLHADELSRIGNRFGVAYNLLRRSMDVAWAAHTQRHQFSEEQYANIEETPKLPEVHALVYAREHAYEYQRSRQRQPEIDLLMHEVQICLSDIRYQDQAVHRPGTPTVAINDWHDEGALRHYGRLLKNNFGATLVSMPPDISHPQAYNLLIERMRQKQEAEGLLWMTQAGARMASKQAFNAGALAIDQQLPGEDPVVAVHGVPLTGQKALFSESMLYNVGSRLVLPGIHPRPSKPGPGFLSVTRSLVSLDALYAQSQEWEGFDGVGPFNPAYGNGGYDGELGARIGNVQLDPAASVIWYEDPSKGVPALDLARMLKEWVSYWKPNAYVPPTHL